jgi:tetratricopeptide (TPR) repeat protein
MRLSVTIVLVAALGWPALAHAGDRAAARAAFQRATQHFDLSEYAQALDDFKEAYRNFEDPSLLFNIAQCYRQLGNDEMAVKFYRTFLLKVPNARNREDVERLIAQLNRAIEDEKQRKSMPPQTPMAPNPPLPEGQAKTPASVPSGVVHADSDRAARKKVIAGAATAGFGVAALAVGAACLGLARATANSLSADDLAGREYDPGKAQLGATYQTVGGVFVGVGAAAVVAGGVVALIGVRERRAHNLALVPALSPRVAGAVLQGTF